MYLQDPKDFTGVIVDPPNFLQDIMMTGESSCRLEESRQQPYLQEGEERDRQQHTAHLNPWESDAATHPGDHFQACQGQEGHWKQ